MSDEPTLFPQVKGLCGMYDHNMLNDFTTSSGIAEAHARDFADNFLSSPSTCNSDLLLLPAGPCEQDYNVSCSYSHLVVILLLNASYYD